MLRQMDGEVPSVSGSHGDLSERSHHGIVGRELVVVATCEAHSPSLCAKAELCLPEERGLINMSSHLDHEGPNNVSERTNMYRQTKITNEMYPLVRDE